MIQSAYDWAAIDPAKNMTLAEADQFGNALAGAFGIQLGDRFVRTQFNMIISEAELRGNQFLSPLPVNLCGTLTIPNCQEFNLASFRISLRKAAQSDDATGALVTLLQQLSPQYTAIPSLFTRMPAVQAVIASALKTI
jgi:hypothetical protein